MNVWILLHCYSVILFGDSACNLLLMMTKVLSIKSYSSILRGLITKGKERLTVPFLSVFLKEYGLKDQWVSKMLLHYLCMKDVDRALWFLRNMVNTPTVTFPVAVLKILAKDGRASYAYKLVKGAEKNLPLMDVVDYSVVIDGLCKEGHVGMSLDICTFAKKKGITPNIVTYNTLLNGLCDQGCFVEAFRLFDSLGQNGLAPTEVTYAILIDNLSKEGFLPDAKWLFDKMVLEGYSLNTHIYNSMIDGYCKFSKMEEALNLLNDLEIRSLKPDEFTFSSVIKGYCLKGDVEGALGFFFEIKRKGGLLDFLGFLYLVSGLCDKGRMEEARSILREMLQTRSVVELISRVDEEVGTESIGSFLSSLCEQGRIKEIIVVLNEVGCLFFPFRRSFSLFNKSQKSKISIVNDSVDRVASKFLSTEREHYYEGFSAYYSRIASLCSNGELQKANNLVKEMLVQFNEG